jgi:hypothetical protein
VKIQVGVSDEINRDFLTWVIIIALTVVCFFRRIKFDQYTHIFFVLNGRMYHSVERGVCDEDFEAYKEKHIIRKLKEIELPCTEDEFFKFHNNFKGRPFAYFQFLNWIPVVGMLFANKLKRLWCAEYVAVGLFVLGNMYQFENQDRSTPLIIEEI